MSHRGRRADVAVPEEVCRSVRRWFGDAGQAWLADLPGLVAGLAERWQLELGQTYSGGSHALVVAVARSDGSPAVLKVPMRDEENRAEAAALALYAGDGAVRLYEDDPKSGALLLERLQPGTPLAEHPDRAAAIGIVCGLARRLWRQPPAGHPFVHAGEIALGWSELLSAAARRPEALPWSPLATEAAALARELVRTSPKLVLVNRDIHLGNVLAAQRQPWLLIDPKPLVGEPAFDAGYLILDLLGGEPTVERARHLIAQLADLLGVPAQRVRGWGLVRAVVNATWALAEGGDPTPRLAQAKCLWQAGPGRGR